MGIGHPVLLSECEEALCASLGNNEEGGGEGGNGHRSLPPFVVKAHVIYWRPDQTKEDDGNLEG